MPQQKSTNKFRYGFKKWADETAISLRKDLDLKVNERLCAFRLCEYLKIKLLTPNDIPNLSQYHKNDLLLTSNKAWSAMTIPIEKEGKYIIIHNPTHSAQRQQSNLMHELAHIICKHEVSNKIIESGLMEFMRYHNQEQENEAEWLGACLQLPRAALIWALKNNMTIDDISTHFCASAEMVNYRINITGVKKQFLKT